MADIDAPTLAHIEPLLNVLSRSGIDTYPSAAAFDSNLQETLVLTGSSPPKTWTWNGARWLLHTVNPHPQLSSGVLVADIHHDEVLALAGGNFVSGGDDRIWQWNGLNWTTDGSHSPAPRLGASASFDLARNVMVIAGGAESYVDCPSYLSDTWEWDGVAWRMIDEWGFQWSCGQQMAYDASIENSIVFNGNIGTWAGVKWHWIYPTKGPECESYASLTYDSFRQRSIVFGGLSMCDDTWEWNAIREQWHQIAATGPSARSSAAMCYDETS